jgi:glyceraldehyde 3-phosphate dehydrogenase
VLLDNFGIKRGMMTTVHAYTGDQTTVDRRHKDLRRARAAAHSIIPTTTGAAKAVGQVIPELAGKLDGGALRVPVIDGSITDLTVELEKSTSADDVNAAVKAASETEKLQRIIEYCDEPIVSCDVIGNPHSSIFDSLSTKVMDGTLLKVLSWYDNEWGYAERCLDLMRMMVAK